MKANALATRRSSKAAIRHGSVPSFHHLLSSIKVLPPYAKTPPASRGFTMLAKTILGLAAFAATASAEVCTDSTYNFRASQFIVYGPDVQRCSLAAGWPSPMLPGGSTPTDKVMAQLCASPSCGAAMTEFNELMNSGGCDFTNWGRTLADLAPSFVATCKRVLAAQLDDDPPPAPASAPWHATPQPKCDVVKLLSATDGDDSTQCEAESRFSFQTATTPPDRGMQKRMCTSSACKSVVAALKSAKLPACTTVANIDFLRELVTWFDSDCEQYRSKADDASPGST